MAPDLHGNGTILTLFILEISTLVVPIERSEVQVFTCPTPTLRPICGEDLPLPGPLQFVPALLLQVSFNFNSFFNALLVSVRFSIRREMREFCCLQRGNCYLLCSSCETEIGLMIPREDLCPEAFF